MGCRGIWNVHRNGKWYRCCHPRGRISPPDDPATLRMIQNLRDNPNEIDKWEIVPFPSPMRSGLDYVYTIDQDACIFMVTLWEALTPTGLRFNLADIYRATTLPFSMFRQKPEPGCLLDNLSRVPAKDEKPDVLVSGVLNIDSGFPTSMNELQGRFFTDLIYTWRFYIDDPLTWRYSCPVFKVLCIAILRLAAWDFEVSVDDAQRQAELELPISFASIPRWSNPRGDVYWFHGYLIVLQEDIDSKAMISSAVSKARAYMNNELQSKQKHYEVHKVRLILISLRSVAFVELFHDIILSTRSLSLLTNHSAAQCSPGFRALARVLTSDCWKNPYAQREKWHFYMPPEIIREIFHVTGPRDAVALAQASFTAEQYYYSSPTQFYNMRVRDFWLSIPCCGKRDGLEERGICCSKCLAWHHLDCVGLKDCPFKDQYICAFCRENNTWAALDPGGIHRFSPRRSRGGSQIQMGSSIKYLQLRTSKPSHLRRDLLFARNSIPIPPNLIDYAILFNGSFSGLAYGLEDI